MQTPNQPDCVSFGAIGIKYIPNCLKYRKDFVDVFLKTNEKTDKIIENFDFRKFAHNGITMKYPRTKYVEDIKKL